MKSVWLRFLASCKETLDYFRYTSTITESLLESYSYPSKPLVVLLRPKIASEAARCRGKTVAESVAASAFL